MRLSQRDLPTISTGAFQILFTVVLYVFAVPSFIYVFHQNSFIVGQFRNPVFNGYLFLALAIPFAVLWAARKWGEWPFYAFMFGFFIFRIIWFLLLSPELTSDFGTYWRLALEFATGARHLPLTSVWDCRAVPYLVPVITLFGFSLFSLAVVNSAAMVFVSLISYRLTARVFSPPVSAACVVLANMAPEVFGASGIASHDVSGLFFLSLTLALIDVAVSIIRRPGKFAMISIVMLTVLAIVSSIVIFLVDLQRYPEKLVFLVLVLWLIYLLVQYVQQRKDPRQPGGRPLVATGIFVASVVAVTMTISSSASWLRTNCFTYDHELLNFIAYANSFSDGRYDDWYRVVIPMFENVDTQDRKEVLKTMLLSDIADAPTRRWSGIQAKSERLFALGEGSWFYLAKMKVTSDPVRYYKDTAAAYRTILLIAFMLAPIFLSLLYRYGAIKFDAVPYLPFLTISVLIFFLMFSNQIQARYIFPIYFYGILAYAWPFACAEMALNGREQRHAPVFSAVSPAFVIVLALLIVGPVVLYIGVGKIVDRLYSPSQGRLVDLDQASVGGTVATLPRLSQIPQLLSDRRSLRALIPVFGGYEKWIWADREGTWRSDYRACGLPANATFDVKGVAGVQLLDAKPGTRPKAVECHVRAGELQHDCRAAGAFVLSSVPSDWTGCINFSHEIAVVGNEPSGSWLAFVRAVQHAEPAGKPPE